ncbi:MULTISPECIES: thioesterase family protein [unclassified Psychrobacter]|uniref:thioesterase family protein n=1 Tax=unclassified Psychrobacter TaxID=196806 RepID=UPI0018F40434|nr:MULTISPECIES: thioesterase family protein [unclassified Psychrobacter]
MSNHTTSGAQSPLFTADYRVYINHTDAGGIVYHANHLVFFENCRRDWFTQLGLDGYFLKTDAGEIQHFVVSKVELDYRHAILLDETISVRVDTVELKPASIVFYQSIWRTHLDGDTKLSSGKVVIACVQNNVKSKDNDNDSQTAKPAMRPIRVPKVLYDSICAALSQQQGI